MDYTQVQQSLIEYYQNLLIIQYHEKPKAKATVALLMALIWVNMIFLQIRDAFDWRTAVGKQLDIIGQWVGVNRFYNGVFYSFRPWFSLIDWNSDPDNLQGGFSTFETFESLEGGIITYNYLNSIKNHMVDDLFRQLIGLKIIKNSIYATAKNIDNAIWAYFNGQVYTTWAENEIIYHFDSALREVMLIAQYKKVLPAPTGVTITLQEIINNG